MDGFRNYVFAVAGFVILAGTFTVIGPYVDLGQADPPVKNVNVVNTAANPVPVVVQNGGEPDGEEDIAIVGCGSESFFTQLVILSPISSFSAGVPSLPELNDQEPCAAAIAALTKEGFQRSDGGNGSSSFGNNRTRVRFVIVLTRNKLP